MALSALLRWRRYYVVRVTGACLSLLKCSASPPRRLGAILNACHLSDTDLVKFHWSFIQLDTESRMIEMKQSKTGRRASKRQSGSTNIPPIYSPEDFFRVLLGGLFGGIAGAGFAASTAPPVVVSPIPEPMFRKMIALCHPDKHVGTAFHDMALEVTQWLTEEREKSRSRRRGRN